MTRFDCFLQRTHTRFVAHILTHWDSPRAYLVPLSYALDALQTIMRMRGIDLDNYGE